VQLLVAGQDLPAYPLPVDFVPDSTRGVWAKLGGSALLWLGADSP